MFNLITGKPGSGKSYYAVHHMIKNKSNYKTIYANVNGLKMVDNIKPLNFEKLMVIVKECKEIYDFRKSLLGENEEVNVIDDYIVEYLLEINFIELNPKYKKSLLLREERKADTSFKGKILSTFSPISPEPKYLPILIIMDEAQDDMPAKDSSTGRIASVDPIISWWISYHRHLFMDVFLLSQNYHKINPAYIYDIEYFLDAVPSSRNVLGSGSKSFKYRHYLKTPYSKTVLVDTIKVEKSKDVFDAYKSGDKVRTKSAILKFLYIFVFGLLIVGLLGWVIVHFVFGSKVKHDSPKVKTHSSEYKYSKSGNTSRPYVVGKKSNITVSKFDMKEMKYIDVKCVVSTCTNKLLGITLNVTDLKDLLKDTDSKYLHSKRVSKNLVTMYLLVSPDFLGLFNQGAKNDEVGFGFNN